MRTCRCADNRAWWEDAIVQTSELDENVLMWRHQSLMRTCHHADIKLDENRPLCRHQAWWEHAAMQTSKLDENVPLCRQMGQETICTQTKWQPDLYCCWICLTQTIDHLGSYSYWICLTQTKDHSDLYCYWMYFSNILHTRKVVFSLQELYTRKVVFYHGYSGMPSLYRCGTLLSRYECYQGALYSLFVSTKYAYNYNGFILVGWLRKDLLHSQYSQNSHHKNQEELYIYVVEK